MAGERPDDENQKGIATLSTRVARNLVIICAAIGWGEGTQEGDDWNPRQGVAHVPLEPVPLTFIVMLMIVTVEKVEDCLKKNLRSGSSRSCFACPSTATGRV